MSWLTMWQRLCLLHSSAANRRLVMKEASENSVIRQNECSLQLKGINSVEQEQPEQDDINSTECTAETN